MRQLYQESFLYILHSVIRLLWVISDKDRHQLKTEYNYTAPTRTRHPLSSINLESNKTRTYTKLKITNISFHRITRSIEGFFFFPFHGLLLISRLQELEGGNPHRNHFEEKNF